MYLETELKELEQKKLTIEKQIIILKEELKEFFQSDGYLIVDLNLPLTHENIVKLLDYLGEQLGLKKIIVLGKNINEEKKDILRCLIRHGFSFYSSIEKLNKFKDIKYLIVYSDWEKYNNDVLNMDLVNNIFIVGNIPRRVYNCVNDMISNSKKFLGWKSKYQIKKEINVLTDELKLTERKIEEIKTRQRWRREEEEEKNKVKVEPEEPYEPYIMPSARVQPGSPMWDNLIMYYAAKGFRR